MSQVSDLRRALAEEMNRLQPAPGLESRVLERALSAYASAEAGRNSGSSSNATWLDDSLFKARMRSPRMMTLIAALLAVAIVATLVFAAHTFNLPRNVQVGPGPVPATPLPDVQLLAQLPEADLAPASLANAPDLVTRFKLVSQDSGHTVKLIGAYADTARTVLFFRTAPDLGFPNVGVSDDQGPLNASSSGANGIPGDHVFVLDRGPRPGADGIANLSVTISDFSGFGPTGLAKGNWSFTLPLALQPSTALTLTPKPAAVGSWKLTIETIELTPTVIHFQVVIDGASVAETTQSTITLVDAARNYVNPVAYSASVTVPKQQITPTTYQSTRMNVQWPRPATAQAYQLQITGGGAVSRSELAIEAPQATPHPAKWFPPLSPTDYPAQPVSLTFDGALNAQVTTAYPTSCGAASGPDGELFSFAAYFQAQGAWYLIKFETDYLSRQYKGPGTYTVKSAIYPRAPNGYSDPIYAGSVQLSVRSQSPPDTGSVRGTLDWITSGTETVQVNVSGTWRCTPGPLLGPG